jgi:hypothetical protein
VGDCGDEEPDETGDEAGVVGVAAVTVGGGGGVHDSDSERIGRLTGKERLERGVPVAHPR